MIPFNPQNRLRRGLEFRDVEELRQVTQRRQGPRQASEQNLAAHSHQFLEPADLQLSSFFMLSPQPTAHASLAITSGGALW